MMLGQNSYGDHSSFPLSPNERFHFFPSDSLLQRYLQSNTDNDVVSDFQISDLNENGDFLSVDAHSCDHFRMYDFKVKKCARVKSHDWEECPFVHPGEKARRRDPRKFHYSGSACPDFRRGGCLKGDACEYAHGVFECWLHPARYRTQACKDGMKCRRRVCFFAHSPDQLRVVSPHARESFSPPVESPVGSPIHSKSINDVVASLRMLQLSKLNSMPSSWTSGSTLSLSPRVNMTRPGFFSLPTTPTGFVTRPGIGYFDSNYGMEEEEPVMERVESGRDLRARMFEKLSKENPLDRVEPDLGWVTEVLN